MIYQVCKAGRFYFLGIITTLFISLPLAAQPSSGGTPVSGTIVDAKEQKPVGGATIQLINQADTTQRRVTISDISGKFSISRVRPGQYNLRVTFVGYKSVNKPVLVQQDSVLLGRIQIEEDMRVLGEIKVEGQEIRAEQKGDTLIYNAAAFKVNKDATVEDLVKKMPGVVIENGEVKAQGETVRRVLLDGQEFLGNDAMAALRNLPADIVSRVQVFDRQSDQAQFTGFNDGNQERTLNIMTTGGVNNAQFGKLYAGTGTESRYNTGGNLSWFNGQQRLSLVGLSNNMNQQNFSPQDLLGLMGGGSTGGFGGMGGMGSVIIRATGAGGGPPGNISFGGMGGGGNDFFVGQQAGINKTHSIGLNYTNRFSQKLNVNASYFFNQATNNTDSDIQREFFGNQSISQLYNENSLSSSKNGNHRFNARITWTIDKYNSFIITPRLSTQNNESNRSNFGQTLGSDLDMINSSQNVSSVDNFGLNLGGNILYRRSFDKRGRTFSLSVNSSNNSRDGDNYQKSTNIFVGSGMGGSNLTQRINQWTTTPSDNVTLGGSVNYTEPVGKNSQVQLSYNPSLNNSLSERYTYAYDTFTNDFTIVDSLLSNEFDNKNITQRGGVTYRYNYKKVNLSLGANYQNLRLISDQTFPVDFYGTTSFNSVLPEATFEYRVRQNSQIRMQYRTFTRAPSISQLQNVIDNSNPLSLSSGNPDLGEQFSHNVNLRYNLTRVAQGQTLLLFMNANVNQNYIGQSTLTALKDTLLADGVILRRGGQFTRPDNLGEQKSLRSFLTFGFPFKPIKSNINFNLGGGVTRTPSLLNNQTFYSDNASLNSGVVISSTISPQVDFTLSYNLTLSNVTYQQPNIPNNSYNAQRGSFQLTFTPWNKLVLVNDLAFSTYDGLGEDIDQSLLVLNLAVGYKFLKNNAGELRLTAFDLLNQNNSINRQITDTYIQDSVTQALTRYFVLNFTYNLRNFNSGNTPQRPSEMGMPREVRFERF